MQTILAIDAMGGDHSLKTTIPACIKFIKHHPDVKLQLIGDKELITKELNSKLNKYTSQYEIVHASQVVDMDEPPQLAMRNKKDSSMRVALNLLKTANAQAVVSSGNTGALMATARYVLGTMDGIDRPAIAKLMPTITGQEVCVLDLGASLEATPEHLLQFGILGSQFMRGVLNKEKASVGILNIGSENIKGTDNIKKAYARLQASDLNFYGNVEGDDITKGTVDVIVCDGFTGNVALKTLEGTAKMISHIIRQEFNQSLFTRLLALFTLPVIRRIRLKLDSRKYNGAALLGLNGLVIKSHGGADDVAFYYALEQAYSEVKSGFINSLQAYLNASKDMLIKQDEMKKEDIEFKGLYTL